MSTSKESSQLTDTKNLLIKVSEITQKLPISIERKKQFYNVIYEFMKGRSRPERKIDDLREVLVEKVEQDHANHPSTDIDYEIHLNRIFDDLWTFVDEENYFEFQILFDQLRKLFRMLFEKMNVNQRTLHEMNKKLDNITEEIKDFNISQRDLLLGSLSQQIQLKIAKYLNGNISLFSAMSFSMSDFNRMENIDSLKSLLQNNGYNWVDLQITIKVFKHNRLPIGHPGDSVTTRNDIQTAIETCFPDPTSEFRIKAIEALQILRLLAEQLHEPLFISIPH